MARLKMKRLSLAASMTDSKMIIDALQRLGAVELSEPEETEGFYTMDTSASVSQTERYISVAENAAAVLDKYAPRKGSLTDFLKPRKELTAAQFAARSADADKTLSVCLAVNSAEREMADCAAGITRCRTKLLQLAPWKSVDVPFTKMKSRHAGMIAGAFPKQYSREDVLNILAAALPDNEAVDCSVVSDSPEQTCVLVLCMNADRTEVKNALRAAGMTQMTDNSPLSPAQRIQQYEKEIEKLEKKREELEASIKEKEPCRDDIDFLLDFLIIRKDKNSALSKVLMNSRIFVIEGWIPENRVDDLKGFIENSRVDAAYDIRDPLPDDDEPVKLKNGWLSAPVEDVTEMYSLPSKTDIDPTPFMSLLYYVFFGMMLSDAGYGLLIAGLTGALLLKYRNMESKWKNTLRKFFFCGVSTVFWGAMYGSWFGDFPNVVRHSFLGLTDVRIYLWTDPLQNIMKVLVFCFIIGLICLFWGEFLNGLKDIKQGHILDAICDTVPTYTTIIGIAPVFLKMFMPVPEWMTKYNMYVLIAGVVLIVLTRGRHAPTVAGKITGGLAGLYNVFSGYLGDVLSFSRLLALGLSTGVVAQVINMLATLPQNMALKIVMTVVVFPLGHLMNIAINAFGAYVHTNRLMFVEFFGKFYEGGGRAFSPLKANTKSYRFKEEISNV